MLFLLIIYSGASIAQINYRADLISKDLLPYASAIIRNKEVTIQVADLNSTIYHIKTAITVLNKNGDNLARIVIWHNKSNNIKYVKGLIYDEYGKQTSKFSESNFDDVSAANDFSLFEDSRVKHYSPPVTSYPYTIEYEYELRSKQTLNFDSWKPINQLGLAIEKSSFTFICKPDFKIKYKEINLLNKAVITINGEGLKTYSWQVNNVKAIKDEPYSPNPETYLGSVKIAPENFSYEGIKGSFTNWNELGKWTYDKLLLNRDMLSAETKAHIIDITKDIADAKEKARKIYEYMQQKTRYISIQIGIGGYQPFIADEVDKLGYGDCKGLVNYTQALLKVAGIESYYCVVEAGNEKRSMLPDFASMDQGNHVILCVPFKNDTTWLECTSQKIPFGFLGDFTDDRTVLACTPQGGKLLHTPRYLPQANLQIRKAKFNISATGELSGDMQTTFEGTQYDNREEFMGESSIEQEKLLKKIYPINNLDIGKFMFKQDKSSKPVTTETVSLVARDYASVNNNKLYFLINSVNRRTGVPREIRNRTTSVYLNDGYTDEDEISYTLPKGYHFEKLPLNLNVEKPFGTYQATMVLKGNVLTYKRRIAIIDGTYDKSAYQDLIDFYQTVVEADNYNTILVKNN